MKLVAQSAPYIRKPVSVKRMMMDVLIALVPVLLFACIQNGWSGIYVILISVVTMLITELFCHLFIKWPSGMKLKELFHKEGWSKVKKQYTINNFTAPLISAIIYALLLPANCNGYVVFIGALFGMLIGKMIFGGLGSNIFNPAATGRVFVGVCFGSKLIYGQGGVGIDVTASGTPLAAIKGNLGMVGVALENYSLLDLFLGSIPGSMGEVSALFILIGAIYLFVRRSADLRACLSMILSFAVITLVASITTYFVWQNEISQIRDINLMMHPWNYHWNVFDLFMYEMLAGGLLFGAVFMITDPVTSPTTKFGRVAFGAMAGIITALVRYCGAYPEGVAFSILIANMFAPAMDYLMRGKKNTYTWKQILGLSLTLIVICLIVGFSVASQVKIGGVA